MKAASRLVLVAVLSCVGLGSLASASSVSPAPSTTSLPTAAQVVSALKSAESRDTIPSGSITPPLSATGLFWTSVNPTLSNPSKPGCVINDAATAIPANIGTSCAYGDPTSSTVIALVGDSNANAWIPGLDTWGYVNKVKVVAVVHAACAPWDRPWLPKDKPIWGDITERKCSVWRSSMMQKVQALAAKLVLPVGIAATDKALSFPTKAALVTSLNSMITSLGGKKVALLEPVPQFPLASSVLACFSGHSTSLRQCEVKKSAVAANPMNQAITAAAKAKGVSVVPTINLFCGATTCPLFVSVASQNYLVYEDGYHVSHQYSQIVGAALPLKSLLR